MYMIKITKDKVDHLAETAEKMLKYGGKLMQCLEELKESENYGERGDGYGERFDGGRRTYREMPEPQEENANMRNYMGERYGERMGMREGEGYGYGERRGRSSMTGRYTAY